MKYIKSFLIILIVTFFCSTSLQAANFKIIQFPYSIFFSKNKIKGKGYGLSTDVVYASFKKERVKVKLITEPMVLAVKSFLSKEKALVMIGTSQLIKKMSRMDRKLKITDFGMKKFGHFRIELLYFGKYFPNGFEWNTFDDIRPFKIGTLQGSPTTPILQKANLNIEVFKDIDTLANKLKKNQIDLWQCMGIAAQYNVMKLFPEELSDFKKAKEPIYEDDVAIVYWVKDPESVKIAEIFEKGFLKLYDSGEYLAIYERYMGKGNVSDDILFRKHEDKIWK